MNIIPLPAQIETHNSEFHLNADTVVLTDTANRWNAEYLHGLLATPTCFPLPIRTEDRGAKNSIYLRLDSDLNALGREGYRLTVLPDTVTVESADVTGVFYGIQSLRQLLPVEIEEHHPPSGTEWKIACLTITDRLRFGWRGFMLDEGRHFLGKGAVFLTLDLMALQKFNVLHWHLTEDDGWRIEIKRYPRLTEVGAWRAGSTKNWNGPKHDGVPHGGFYTQEEVREIVAYAAERHITIVPEIELPGHSVAALAAYPELSCRAEQIEVSTHFGVHEDIYCAGREGTFTFLQIVLDEVIELFPSPYIHIGGDEAPKARWKECPDCQRRIRKEGLKDEHALQVYFTNRMVTHLASKGRRAIGWSEILEDGLDKNAMVQHWIGNVEKVIDAIRTDQRAIVMSPFEQTYLDHSHWAIPLRQAYHFEPVPPGLEDKDILGVEFPLWTEWVGSRARMDYQTYPRLTAFAERAWSAKNAVDYRDFRRRLDGFLKRMDRFEVRYAPLSKVDASRLAHWLGIRFVNRPQHGVAKR